jgi:hypothetical protein
VANIVVGELANAYNVHQVTFAKREYSHLELGALLKSSPVEDPRLLRACPGCEEFVRVEEITKDGVVDRAGLLEGDIICCESDHSSLPKNGHVTLENEWILMTLTKFRRRFQSARGQCSFTMHFARPKETISVSMNDTLILVDEDKLDALILHRTVSPGETIVAIPAAQPQSANAGNGMRGTSVGRSLKRIVPACSEEEPDCKETKTRVMQGVDVSSVVHSISYGVKSAPVAPLTSDTMEAKQASMKSLSLDILVQLALARYKTLCGECVILETKSQSLKSKHVNAVRSLKRMHDSLTVTDVSDDEGDSIVEVVDLADDEESQPEMEVALRAADAEKCSADLAVCIDRIRQATVQQEAKKARFEQQIQHRQELLDKLECDYNTWLADFQACIDRLRELQRRTLTW